MLWWCACVFFFKQKTEYEMRISDWSSDVCSSDLRIGQIRLVAAADIGGDLRGPAFDLEPAGQHAGARTARIDRRVHRRRNRIEPRLALFETAVREFILEHHFGKALTRRRANVQQVGARGKGEEQLGPVLGAAAVVPRP